MTYYIWNENENYTSAVLKSTLPRRQYYYTLVLFGESWSTWEMQFFRAVRIYTMPIHFGEKYFTKSYLQSHLPYPSSKQNTLTENLKYIWVRLGISWTLENVLPPSWRWDGALLSQCCRANTRRQFTFYH